MKKEEFFSDGSTPGDAEEMQKNEKRKKRKSKALKGENGDEENPNSNPFEDQSYLQSMVDVQQRRSINMEYSESPLVSDVPLSEFSNSKEKKKGKKRKHDEAEAGEVEEESGQVDGENQKEAKKQIATWNKRTRVLDDDTTIETRRIKTTTRKFDKIKDKHPIMPFEDAVELIKSTPMCGIKIVREQRHLSMPMHLTGENFHKAVNYILQNSIGKFRRQALGVVLSIGAVNRVTNGLLIDEQMSYHTDVLVTMAIFRPSKGHHYEAVVTHVSHDFFSALILNVIAIKVPITNAVKKSLQNHQLQINDKVLVLYKQSTVNRGMCLLQGEWVKLKEKGIPPTEEEIEEAELEFSHLEEKMKSPAKNKNKEAEKAQEEERFTEPANKRVRFADTDSETLVTPTDDDTDDSRTKKIAKQKRKEKEEETSPALRKKKSKETNFAGMKLKVPEITSIDDVDLDDDSDI
ncbi:hypothetical protein WR25_22317 [Diploscapter pachys]|uniref:RPA43 OB domain-containing protein n=1 Tax=Diploscapter pachys TaxID=2018661 RepID=A0A2A2L130_9BILA|nr:hypothetical protein WR25_22317 [Diploscapter pachys]